MSEDNRTDAEKLVARYKIISHTISPFSKRTLLGIRDHANDSVFETPVRIAVADDAFITQMSAQDVRLATLIDEADKYRYESTQKQTCECVGEHE